MQKIDKPWGYELIWAHVPGLYAGKILHINKGEALSLQYHVTKDETIYINTGVIELVLNQERITMEPGDSKRIAPGTIHQMIALEAADVFEVSTDHLTDLVRLQDRYGRVSER